LEELFIKVIKITDSKSLEFVQVLTALGVRKNVACALAILKDQGEKSSKNIEMLAGLRQPEVSIAMRTLRERGWLQEREIGNSGKGRPRRMYSLQVSIDEIINYFEEQKKQEFIKTSEIFQKLKSSA